MNAAAGEAQERLHFLQRLGELTGRIRATPEADDIMLEMSAELCNLFCADRITIYALSPDGACLESKLKTGLASFKQLKLPVSKESVAGYAALARRMVNLADVYDEAGLRAIDPALRFQQGVDRRTGYRTRQMLAAPILDGERLLGVVQLINNTRNCPFSAVVEEATGILCDAIATAFARAAGAPERDRSRFALLLPDAVLPRAQLETAMRSAAARGLDIEDVLLDELGIRIGIVGRALAQFYGVPYFTFQVERRRPQRLLDAFNRDFVVRHGWMPLEEGRNGLFVLAVDPDAARASGAFARVFPDATPIWCVTTRREFGWMTTQFFGADSDGGAEATTIRPGPGPARPDVSQALVGSAVLPLLEGALRQGVRELHIATESGPDGTIRFTVTGVLAHGRG
ncbi:GAF domain-containing protein [Pseudoduganella plicata]|uniref:GAF domain-containing protein n=1 Tax=Pseudoduganella plicata TaxID=321984 RepID=A0A4P7B9K4_9BURK|nr:GAF domain-containing protein [Pseudoduganella plicata]QBQ35034.1 GAF domain-containing protein [Pseudoduganella plicata]GGZ06963.1 hypothetical protein GCM10007388_45710 [Pseudoduganella plicata]